MKITAIKQQVKQSGRVSIFVDGQYSFSLNYDQLLDTKLKKNDELDEADIKRLKKLSDEGKLKQRALEWLLTRPHSTRELRDYLYKKKAEKVQIEAWIEEFTEKKYLSDESFAIWFAEQRSRKNKSKRSISAELRGKGINQEYIDNVLQENVANDIDAINKLIEKVGNRPRYKDKQKLTAYLTGKGFNYSDIKSAMRED